MLQAGLPLERARAAVILTHGRGGSADDILTLGNELGLPECAFLAPQAAGSTWYPFSFLAELEHNQPGLSSGLSVLDHLVAELSARGIRPSRVVLVGFSQGACLTLEYAARHARRFGGIAGLTGGLIGPPGTEWAYEGSFAGTPILLGAGDPDPHVPWTRVEETAAIFESMGATVDLRRYPGMGHAINQDELAALRKLILELLDD